MAGDMPHGQSALHPLWPEARWNISGLFVFDRVIFDLLTVLEDRFGAKPIIDSIHGAPGVLWNSGRISEVEPVKPKEIAQATDMFNAMGIGVYFTFTNHLLSKGDLDDTTCNAMLEAIDNGRGMNGVILASDLLYEHVRTKFPSLKLTASIVKVSVDDGEGKSSYYAKACERFDSVMLHPDDAFKPALLEKLDRDKIEIIVNENCVRHCSIRSLHYKLMVEQFNILQEYKRTGKKQPLPLEKHENERCLMPLQKLTGNDRSCNLTEDELAGIYNQGYRRFKLQGRGDSPTAFMYDLTRYLLEPGRVAPVVYKSMVMGWAQKHVATIMQKRQKG